MTKKLVCIRASEATQLKLEQLADHYGTKTTVIEVAIDRLWQQDWTTLRPIAEVMRDAQAKKGINL